MNAGTRAVYGNQMTAHPSNTMNAHSVAAAQSAVHDKISVRRSGERSAATFVSCCSRPTIGTEAARLSDAVLTNSILTEFRRIEYIGGVDCGSSGGAVVD